MQESRAITLWAVAFGVGFIGILALTGTPSGTPRGTTAKVALQPQVVPLQPMPAVAPSADPAAMALPADAPRSAAATATVTKPPAPAPAAAPVRKLVTVPAAFETVPAARAGDNPEARAYTDALNALSLEGYSGVDSIVPDGERFRAVAIMEGRRIEVLVDPGSGAVRPLGRPR